MKIDKAIKHKARQLAGCDWHSRIKKSSKRAASKNARRIAKRMIEQGQ